VTGGSLPARRAGLGVSGGGEDAGVDGADGPYVAGGALRYQHVVAGRDQAIAAALDELVQAAAKLPSAEAAEEPSGTNQAREVGGSGPPRWSGAADLVRWWWR
jgi:hypothetical protein